MTAAPDGIDPDVWATWNKLERRRYEVLLTRAGHLAERAARVDADHGGSYAAAELAALEWAMRIVRTSLARRKILEPDT